MKLGVTLDILNQKATPAFYADTLANRPAAGYTGRVFISTDTLDLYRDTGTTWVLLSPSSTGTITGSGSAGQVTFFSGTSSITGTNNLFWDTTNLRLGINTNTAGASLDVHSATGIVAQLNVTTATNNTELAFQNAGTGKWRIGNSYNAGANDFQVYDVVNSLQRFSVKNTGQTFVGTQTTSSGLFVVNSATGDNHIVAIGATAPSIRVRNAGSAPTQQFGLGLATATNNFIQGSASGDFCIFNGSTTASPITFGVYDAGAGNIQEAARISAARNFLIGTTTDNGQKLQVSGQVSYSSSATIISYINTTNVSGASNIYQQSGVNVGWIGNGSSSLIGGSTNDFTINGVNNLNLAVGGYGRLTIASTGNIGISTTSPDQKLTIQAAGTSQGLISFKNAAGTSTSFIGVPNANGDVITTSTTLDLCLRNDTGSILFGYSNSEKMRIAVSTGNLLIGTTTDSGYKLNVNGSAAINGNTDISSGSTASNFNIISLLQPNFTATAGPYLSLGLSNSVKNSAAFQFIYTSSGSDANYLRISLFGNVGIRVKGSGVINLENVPTSAAGLVSGDVYRTANVLNIVP